MTVFNEQFEANKALFKEDELLVVQGQARNDAFTGGIRFTVEAAMDLERARSLALNEHDLRTILVDPPRAGDTALPTALGCPCCTGGGR